MAKSRFVVDQYKVRESCAIAQTRGYPYEPFPEVCCLDAPEYVPSGAHQGYQSKYSDDGRVVTGLGVMR